MNTLAIIVACGKEEQIASGVETAFLSLGNRPVLAHSLRQYQTCKSIDGIVVVVSKDRVDGAVQVVKRFGGTKVCGIVVGGANRLSSLRNVFSKVGDLAPTILIQESSRPFVSQETINESIKAAKRYGCAIAATRVPDEVKLAPKGLKPEKTLDKNTAWIAQTPQVFKREVIEKIVTSKTTKPTTDESGFVKKPSEVHMIEASSRNMKIRSTYDLSVATAIFNANLK